MTKHLVPAAMITLAWGGTALAETESSACHLQLVALPSEWKLGNVDPFASEPAFGSFDLTLVNDGGAACSVRLALDTQGAPFGLSVPGGPRSGYSIYDHASGADLTPRTGQSRHRTGAPINVPAHGQSIARFDMVVPDAFGIDGKYTQALRINADDSQGESLAQRMVTLAVEVNSSATMALSGEFTRTGSNASVDLGDITSNMIRVPLMLHVNSTRAYHIDAASQNGGRLVLAGSAWSVNYKLTLDGQAVSADGGRYASTLGAMRRLDNLPLGFAISGDTNVEAGRYSDVITLTISVN